MCNRIVYFDSWNMSKLQNFEYEWNILLKSITTPLYNITKTKCHRLV